MASYDSFTDRELTSLLLSGDESAFSQIFMRYNGLLYSHAYKKLRNREEAKDVIQDVFALLWTKRHEIDFKSNLTGYLYTAVRNKIFDFISHQTVESKYLGSLQNFLDNGTAVTDHVIREKQISAIIEKEIAALPPRMRLVFELSRKKYMSHKEIAEELGISQQTVTDQIKKALKILRAKLGLVTYLIFLFNYKF
ncbi:ECF RNA polymerase sigma factor RpoE [compost metagenome]